MKKLVLILLFLGALVFGKATPVLAETDEGQIIPVQVVAPLMAWVEQATGTKVETIPTVIASRTKLLQIAGRTGQVAGRPRAVYVAGVVFVDHLLWDDEDDTQKSLLIHELVHHAQAQRTIPVGTCAQSKEVEAYTLQNKWLEANDHSPFVSASWIARMASCGTTTTVASLAQAE